MFALLFALLSASLSASCPLLWDACWMLRELHVKSISILMKLKRKQNDYSAISHGYDKEKNAFDNPVIFPLYLEISNGPGSHYSRPSRKAGGGCCRATVLMAFPRQSLETLPAVSWRNVMCEELAQFPDPQDRSPIFSSFQGGIGCRGPLCILVPPSLIQF